jgi:glycosyltransferase involved in cell wall biosynthesis
MASARPVVGSAVGGILETVVDGLTGTLIPSRDPVRLADALEALARDPEKRQQLGQAGRRRALAEFSVAEHVNRVQSIYDQMLDPRNQREASR